MKLVFAFLALAALLGLAGINHAGPKCCPDDPMVFCPPFCAR